MAGELWAGYVDVYNHVIVPTLNMTVVPGWNRMVVPTVLLVGFLLHVVKVIALLAEAILGVTPVPSQ